MEEVILKGVGLAITAGWASFGLCVDCMCPGSACDPLTCTFCCCGMVPTVRGAELERLARAARLARLARAVRSDPRP
jgi:hypothetical protein